VSRIRLHFDEDATQHALVASLRARRVDVVTALDCGMVGKSDEGHLSHASSEGRVLYSFNIKDYSLLHEQSRAMDQQRPGARWDHSRIPAALFHRRTTAAAIAPSEREVGSGNAVSSGVPL
jgi:hypothetical protein